MFWKEAYYQYIALPNGFSPAVRVFTKVLTPPFKYLRPKGHLSVKYIDDSLLLGETFEICSNNIRATVAPLQKLGFVILDSVKMTITLTEERKQSIYTICQSILSNYQATIRELAQTIGVIVSPIRAVSYGQMYYKELENCKVQSLARSGGNFNRKAYISEEAACIRNIFYAFVHIKLPPFDLTIFSDASLEC